MGASGTRKEQAQERRGAGKQATLRNNTDEITTYSKHRETQGENNGILTLVRHKG